jgi:hypothetical protein
MASSPTLKVYDAAGEYIASVKYAEHAAVLVSVLGAGATIRQGHARRMTLWTEGHELQPAAESYDFVANLVYERMVR